MVYFYAPGRAGENAETFLTGFDGILQIDGYQGYNRLTKPSRKGGTPVRVAHCWAHARRKLKEVFDRDGSEIAAEGLHRIAEFYAVEADIRGISPGQRLSARQARTAPLVAAFGDWLQAQRRKVSSKSRLGEKLTYIHNHWNGLQTFLTDGRVEIDNNRVENLIRPIALNRKNALFAGHDEGGIAWGRIASLIETALCRTRHKQVYAARRTMPNGSGRNPPFGRAHGWSCGFPSGSIRHISGLTTPRGRRAVGRRHGSGLAYLTGTAQAWSALPP